MKIQILHILWFLLLINTSCRVDSNAIHCDFCLEEKSNCHCCGIHQFGLENCENEKTCKYKHDDYPRCQKCKRKVRCNCGSQIIQNLPQEVIENTGKVINCGPSAIKNIQCALNIQYPNTKMARFYRELLKKEIKVAASRLSKNGEKVVKYNKPKAIDYERVQNKILEKFFLEGTIYNANQPYEGNTSLDLMNRCGFVAKLYLLGSISKLIFLSDDIGFDSTMKEQRMKSADENLKQSHDFRKAVIDKLDLELKNGNYITLTSSHFDDPLEYKPHIVNVINIDSENSKVKIIDRGKIRNCIITEKGELREEATDDFLLDFNENALANSVLFIISISPIETAKRQASQEFLLKMKSAA